MKVLRHFVPYYRVSTIRQGKSGLGLEAQKAAVHEYVRGQKGFVLAEFSEVESGRKSDNARPQLSAALALCRKQPARLVIAKLDRLARNVAFVSHLMQSGVDFVCVDMPDANKFTIHVLAAVAEYEREMMSTRLKEAFAAMKARGQKIGGRKVSKARQKVINQLKATTRQRLTKDYAIVMRPVIEDLRRKGLTSYYELSKALNARGYLTRTGRKWTPYTLQGHDIQSGMWSIRKDHSQTTASVVALLKIAPIIREIQRKGITEYRGIALELARRGVPAPRGGQWHSSTVSRLVPRLEMAEQPDFLRQLSVDNPKRGRSIVRIPPASGKPVPRRT